MPDILKRVSEQGLSRRTFLAASTAAVAGAALAGCSPTENTLEENPEAPAFESEGKWVSAACWLNCGGKCYNGAYVVDGVVKYQKTDDLEEDSIGYSQQRGCVRGRSTRHLVYAPDRIRYPMKRKNWSLEEPNGHLRGKDEWERISWDEALDLVVAGLKKAIEKDGNRSITLHTWGVPQPYSFINGINAMGGATTIQDTASVGTYLFCHVFGINACDVRNGNDRFDLVNCDTIVFYGANPAWAASGQPNWYAWQAKEAGAKFITVGPSKNASTDLYEAKWIRVRPGTDVTFLLSVAYVMLTEDSEDNPMIDWDFLNRCTVGFDADHMPADATLNENFKDYVLGVYDGIPKTPEWASVYCGTPVEDIYWFAREMGCRNNVGFFHSYAAARCNDADDFPQIFMTIGAMGGHMGKPGNCTGGYYNGFGGNGGPELVNSTYGAGLNLVANPVGDVVFATDIWKAILEEKYQYANGAWADPSTVEMRDLKVNVIWNIWRNSLQTYPGAAMGIEAYRKVDMVITQGYEYNASAEYSDILLPACTQWEKLTTYYYLFDKGREWLTFPSKVIEPLYESKTDEAITIELLKRFDIDPTTIYAESEEQRYFNFVREATVVTDSGEYVPLVTLTQEDIDASGFKGEPQEGVIGYKELMEQGKYQVKRSADDAYGYILYEAFRKDPEANPLPSKSGKMEIYCQAKADAVNAIGRGPEIKPYPTYRPALYGYEESFTDFEAGVKGEYPYQMYNPHYLRRAHTGYENVAQLREVWENPVFINASDAAEKGVETGDTVLISNPFGKVLRRASVTERLMPGCIALPHGTWMRVDEEKGIDASGSDNFMLPQETRGGMVSGYNTNLVNFEKYTGEELIDDCEVVFGPVGGIE